MGKELDLDDVVAGHPLAMQELEELRKTSAAKLVQVGPCSCSDHECGDCMKPIECWAYIDANSDVLLASWDNEGDAWCRGIGVVSANDDMIRRAKARGDRVVRVRIEEIKP